MMRFIFKNAKTVLFTFVGGITFAATEGQPPLGRFVAMLAAVIVAAVLNALSTVAAIREAKDKS